MGMLVGGFAVGLVNFLISRILKGRKERFRHHIDSIASANQIARFPTSSNFYMVQETLQTIFVTLAKKALSQGPCEHFEARVRIQLFNVMAR